MHGNAFYLRKRDGLQRHWRGVVLISPNYAGFALSNRDWTTAKPARLAQIALSHG